MRVVSAILLSIFLLLGTWGYTNFANSVRRQPVVIQTKMDDASWRIIITRTFDCVPDPESNIDSLVIRFKGEFVYQSSERIGVKREIEIEEMPKVEQGANEIFVSANFATLDDFEFDTEQTRALRVQLFRGYELIKDETFWSEPGLTSIEDSLLFEAPAVKETDSDHPHD